MWLKKENTVVMCEKKYFNQNLNITKKVDKDFKNSTKRWICDNGYADGV